MKSALSRSRLTRVRGTSVGLLIAVLQLLVPVALVLSSALSEELGVPACHTIAGLQPQRPYPDQPAGGLQPCPLCQLHHLCGQGLTTSSALAPQPHWILLAALPLILVGGRVVRPFRT